MTTTIVAIVVGVAVGLPLGAFADEIWRALAGRRTRTRRDGR